MVFLSESSIRLYTTYLLNIIQDLTEMFNKLSVNFYKRFINSKRNKKVEHLFLFGIYDKIFYMEVVMDYLVIERR